MHLAKKQKIKCPACGWWHWEPRYGKPMDLEFAQIMVSGDRGFPMINKRTLGDVERERFEPFALAIYRRCLDIISTVRAAALMRGIDIDALDKEWREMAEKSAND